MQDENLVTVRRRRGEEQELRRGSIKSRIFQMSKRRKKEQPAVSYPLPHRHNSPTGRSDQSQCGKGWEARHPAYGIYEPYHV